MKKMIILLLCFLLAGCSAEPEEFEEAEMVDFNMNQQTTADFDIYMKNDNSGGSLSAGIYISSSSGFSDIYEFESETTTHSMYGIEMFLNDEFPMTHILHCYVNNKTPFITLYPSNAMEYMDIFRLAREFGTLDIPIYINLMPYSANTWVSYDEYKKAWEDVAHVFQAFAPNTHVIWSIFAADAVAAGQAMPDETLFQSLGLMYYGVTENEGSDFINALDTVYSLTNKPIMISSFAVSHYSTANHEYKNQEAAEIIDNIYSLILLSYPNVSGILYMDKDLTVKSPPTVKCNNYRVTDENSLLTAYSTTVSNFSHSSTGKYIKTPFTGKLIDERYYIPREVFAYYRLLLPDMAEESFEYEGYVALDTIDIHFKIENRNLYISEK